MEYVQFRSAFRGFRKEDVVTFLDRYTKEKEQQLLALREENQELRTQLEQKCELAESDTECLEAPIAMPQEVCGEKEQAELLAQTQRADALQTENELLKEQLAQVTCRNADLDAELQALRLCLQEKQAASLSEKELAVYRRAEQTERLARQRATRICKEIDDTLNSGSRQSERDTLELQRMARCLQEQAELLQQSVDGFRLHYRNIGEALREIAEKP